VKFQLIPIFGGKDQAVWYQYDHQRTLGFQTYFRLAVPQKLFSAFALSQVSSRKAFYQFYPLFACTANRNLSLFILEPG